MNTDSTQRSVSDQTVAVLFSDIVQWIEDDVSEEEIEIEMRDYKDTIQSPEVVAATVKEVERRTRAEANRTECPKSSDDSLQVKFVVDNTSIDISAQEKANIVSRAISTLNRPEQELILSHYIEKCSLSQLAFEKGIPTATLKLTIFKALRQLSKTILDMEQSE